MNLILGSLTDLKVHLLNAALRSATDYDATIAAIGKGVAGRFEQYCNRRFYRTVDDTYECNADKFHVSLPRFPLEAVPTFAQRDDLTVGFVDQVFNDLVLNYDLAAGLIDFGQSAPGCHTSRLKFTYTGGFWFPDTDAGTPETDDDLPDGATLLPADLRFAWLIQCARVWSVSDILGVSLASDDSQKLATSTLAALELVPEVKAILATYIRFSLT